MRLVRFGSCLLFAAVVCCRAQDCASLAKLALSTTRINTAELRPPGSFAPPDGKEIPNLPTFCRVAGVLNPSPDSDIAFEVWLPVQEHWNRKFQGVGNGGFAGAINFGQMATAISHGYATASTDTGHHADGVNAQWALGHPEKVVDFGYRAIHETVVAAKQIVNAFYHQQPAKSYFAACSNGGRQALMEAQRFPDDYDGILAGAPAYNWANLVTAGAANVKSMLGTPGSYISEAKLPAIQAASLAACDAIDGVKDGIVSNPPLCHFDPSVLRCQGAETAACLTGPQLAALEHIYGGLKAADGRLLYPGLPPGGEADPGGWGPWITGSQPEKSLMYGFSTQFFKYMVYSDAAWDFRTFDVTKDAAAAKKPGANLDATNTDLSKFAGRGGKLILYHGWNDPAISAWGTVGYVNGVNAFMGADKAKGFLRLFLVPGMQHCAGGAGATDFGQRSTGAGTADRDIYTALEQWVEKGIAPERIIAARPETGLTRPLCAYPSVVRYSGSGSTEDAAHFECVSSTMSK